MNAGAKERERKVTNGRFVGLLEFNCLKHELCPVKFDGDQGATLLSICHTNRDVCSKTSRFHKVSSVDPSIYLM